ncbi:PAS and helix-turn-helix domain-containing protein [Undibacterium oligocarboniphilum]|uniref:PAS and helix-turn-helix domain-containing protein n=1 Tax=Undibacterium oligocarboniphilum TaxID=666702 RepID=A0A850QBN8_9BURK|nr:PAS and helix-turn-helix domain-containing protein [Undibacterium oligocarboniphilum]MBC3869011.1 PAS and helix-turn-helix domain-containing protein [Undibacterium oligocarboniphilum]NVO76991.1 PAS and helix-turn-helix domain-containing protein [Undibacterium oligocarboniphilum]
MNEKPTIDFANIFQQAPIGMCVSQHRIIHACNHDLARMFGYRQEELIGQSFQILYPSHDEFERTGARITPIMNAKGYYSDERIMKRANQELFWCHVSGRGLAKDNPHAAGIWTFEDLSSKRSVTAELTPREREIAALLVEGKTSKLIARQISLSPRTVEMHRAKLMKKFAASTSSELVHKLLGIML